MSKIGQGAIYTRDCFGNEIRTNNESDALKKIYDCYHAELSSKVLNMINKYGNLLLIDVHSFNISKKPDICLGFNNDFTKPNDILIDNITKLFNNGGYSVSLNNPYNGSMRPNLINEHENFKSLMLEVNKKCYLNKDNSINEHNFNKLKKNLNKMAKLLI